MGFKDFRTLVRSFVYIRNNVGPRTEPYGTPQFIDRDSENALFKYTV